MPRRAKPRIRPLTSPSVHLPPKETDTPSSDAASPSLAPRRRPVMTAADRRNLANRMAGWPVTKGT